MWATVASIVVGAILSFLGVMFIEWERQPKLRLSIEDPPTDAKYDAQHPAKDARFVRVLLSNRAMPKGLRWLRREAAIHCTAEIQFYHLEDGAPFFETPMPGRWAGSDEPVSPFLLPNGNIVTILDPTKYNHGFYMDCYPGAKEALDVAAKFDNDAECYAWSNWSYLPGKVWRNAERALPKERILVQVSVYSAGEKISGLFQLENTVSRHDFRLLPATERDYTILQNRAA